MSLVIFLVPFTDQSSSMIVQLAHRPHWCISRQRRWGVPIPFLVNTESGEALTSGDFIRFIANLIAKSDGIAKHPAHIWWNLPLKELLENKVIIEE